MIRWLKRHDIEIHFIGVKVRVGESTVVVKKRFGKESK